MYKQAIIGRGIVCVNIFYVWLKFEAHKSVLGRRNAIPCFICIQLWPFDLFDLCTPDKLPTFIIGLLDIYD